MNSKKNQAQWNTSKYEKMTWTIVGDAETLDGAEILQTSRRFWDWVTGRRRGCRRCKGAASSPGGIILFDSRFFLHGDQESLESVVDGEKARQRDRNFWQGG